MTALMTSIVAIVLFGMMLAATVSYGDALGIMGTNDGINLANRMQTGAALVSQIQHDTGSRPTSMRELVEAGLPTAIQGQSGEFRMACADERCSPMSLCLALPATPSNRTTAASAADRVGGRVSGVCGQPGAAIGEDVVVTLSL